MKTVETEYRIIDPATGREALGVWSFKDHATMRARRAVALGHYKVLRVVRCRIAITTTEVETVVNTPAPSKG